MLDTSSVNVDNELLKQIDSLKMGERARQLKEEFLNCKPRIAGDRARLTAESWQETEGEPIDIRRAKLLSKVLEGVPLVILPGQLLAGNETKYFVGANPICDYNGSYLKQLLDEAEKDEGRMTLGGPVEKGLVDGEDYVSIVEAAKFWKGRTAREKAAEAAVIAGVGDWYEDLVKVATVHYEGIPPCVQCYSFERVLSEGLQGLLKEAREHIQRWEDDRDDDVNKLYFWQAATIVLESVINFARRYSRLASEMAATETDAGRRVELEAIAETCQRVPESPARSFREALQSIVLVNNAHRLESPIGGLLGWGSIDQYLYTYFRKDIDAGRLTLEEAADYLGDFLLFIARENVVLEASWRDEAQKGTTTAIGLGGPNEQGEDVSNELSYLVLHIMGFWRFVEPHVGIRWHKKTPRWLMRKALETNLRVGGGVPQFQNGDHIIDWMVRMGVSLEAARSFQHHGCSQVTAGDSLCSMEPSYINMPICVELTLRNGVASKTGKTIGLQTGDPCEFATFNELYTAFKKQYEYVTRRQLWHDRIVDRVRAEYYRQPLASSLIPSCLEKGQDIAVGGGKHYMTWYKIDRGIVPTAESLIAIKKLIYDERQLTMGELLDALDKNFDGRRGEEIRRLCLAAPKYGNEIDEVDLLVCELGKFSAAIIRSEKSIFGSPYAVVRNGQAWHYLAGKGLGALPSGRKAWEPVADGSLSATQGMDRNGPTALMNSALKADFSEASASVLTLQFPANLLQSEEVREKVVDLTESFLGRGGTYIQYNILDANELREAKKNPEKYRDLVVRVGGYSAYFVHLSPEVQDEIISRTEHGFGAG